MSGNPCPVGNGRCSVPGCGPIHGLRRLKRRPGSRRIGGLAALLALGLIAAPPAQARVISRSAEISVGRETASQVEQFYRVDTDPVAVARVQRIGRRLVACLDEVPYPFEFHVVEDGSVNAFALPGGFIYIFRGLLQLVPNDDALASVMAHEIAHVTERHAVKQFEKNVALSAAITAVLAGTGAPRSVGNAAGVVQAIAGFSFSRRDEADADEHGIELMTKAGYDPRAAAEAMKIVKRVSGKNPPALLRTHPAPESRIKYLTTRAEDLLKERQEARKEVTVPPPPPQPARRSIPALEALEVGPCEWLPLVAGARWTYRVKSSEGAESTLTFRALERLNVEPEGVFRVEYDFGRGVKGTRLLAPAGDRFASAPDSPGHAGPWRVDAVFAEREQVEGAEETVRYAGREKVKVAAGEFDTVKVERVDAEGRVVAASWYARGVGLVKNVSTAAGTTQELLGFYFPR
jgi:Zn-dependent protease with chaperone function